MIDFSTYTFRCSGLKHLMTTSRSKKDLLSETAKTYLRDIYIQEVYGRHRPDINTKYTIKGTTVESDSLDLVKHVTGRMYFKNTQHFENKFIKGTPDVVTAQNLVIDIKSSFDIWTFSAIDEQEALSRYYYQVLGYMWLTHRFTGKLMFCLVNTPEDIIEREMNRYLNPLNVDAQDIELFRKNYIFDDIPQALRLKTYEVRWSLEEAQKLQERILAARDYLGGLSL